MSGKKVIRDKRTVAQKRKDETRGWVVDETPELRRSVDQEIQGKVDTNHPDSCRASMTLSQEEEAMARDIEIARTRARVGEQIETREAGSRQAVQEARQQAQARFDKRAASVDRWRDPAKEDPREHLSGIIPLWIPPSVHARGPFVEPLSCLLPRFLHCMS